MCKRNHCSQSNNQTVNYILLILRSVHLHWSYDVGGCRTIEYHWFRPSLIGGPALGGRLCVTPVRLSVRPSVPCLCRLLNVPTHVPMCRFTAAGRCCDVSGQPARSNRFAVLAWVRCQVGPLSSPPSKADTLVCYMSCSVCLKFSLPVFFFIFHRLLCAYTNVYKLHAVKGNGGDSRRSTCTMVDSTLTSTTSFSRRSTTMRHGRVALTRRCSRTRPAVQPRPRPSPSARDAAPSPTAIRSATQACTGTAAGHQDPASRTGRQPATARPWQPSWRPTALCWGRYVELTTSTRAPVSPAVAARRCCRRPTPTTALVVTYLRRWSTTRWTLPGRSQSRGLRWSATRLPTSYLSVVASSRSSDSLHVLSIRCPSYQAKRIRRRSIQTIHLFIHIALFIQALIARIFTKRNKNVHSLLVSSLAAESRRKTLKIRYSAVVYFTWNEI